MQLSFFVYFFNLNKESANRMNILFFFLTSITDLYAVFDEEFIIFKYKSTKVYKVLVNNIFIVEEVEYVFWKMIKFHSENFDCKLCML